MKQTKNRNWGFLLGGLALMFLSSVLFGDSVEILQHWMDSKTASGINICGVSGLLVAMVGGLLFYFGVSGFCDSNKGTPMKPNHGLRVLLATLACVVVFIINSGVGAIIIGGKARGGLLGCLVLFSVFGWVWRAIVGDSSSSQKTKSVQSSAFNSAHCYAHARKGMQSDIKSRDGILIADNNLSEKSLEHVKQQNQTPVHTPSRHEDAESPVSNSRIESQASILTDKSEVGGDSTLGCLIAGVLVIVVLIAVLSAISSSSNYVTAISETESPIAEIPDIIDELASEENANEKLVESRLENQTEPQGVSLAKQVGLVDLHGKMSAIPVEILGKSCWNQAQSNLVETFDAYWGVYFGRKVEAASEDRWCWKSKSVPLRYCFEPTGRPEELTFFYFSVTPRTHKIWRISCMAKRSTLSGALDEIEKMKKYVAVHTVKSEYFAVDGAWVIYTANTNRTIEIRAQKSTSSSGYYICAEATDAELMHRIEDEGVDPKEDIVGLFGVNFGDVAEGLKFRVDSQNSSLYDFTPTRRFRTYGIYDVWVTPRSHTICKIRAMRKFQNAERAQEEAFKTLEVFKMKFPTIPFRKSTGLREGWTSWVQTFRSEMEFQRTLSITVSPDNFVVIEAHADEDYFDLNRREVYQSEVEKLKSDMDSL